MINKILVLLLIVTFFNSFNTIKAQDDADALMKDYESSIAALDELEKELILTEAASDISGKIALSAAAYEVAWQLFGQVAPFGGMSVSRMEIAAKILKQTKYAVLIAGVSTVAYLITKKEAEELKEDIANAKTIINIQQTELMRTKHMYQIIEEDL